jgi:hypothetical protein
MAAASPQVEISFTFFRLTNSHQKTDPATFFALLQNGSSLSSHPDNTILEKVVFNNGLQMTITAT